ncbi:MAG: zinc ribbon domain-containing protein [Defluviitaleaceae bacterium]|nr:zinc ribbon domain-containing protein [Defluviitaleaceae bacterium]
MIFCSKCGTKAETGNVFCTACGNAITPAVTKNYSKFCPKCGTPNSNNTEFCPNCRVSQDTEIVMPLKSNHTPNKYILGGMVIIAITIIIFYAPCLG